MKKNTTVIFLVLFYFVNVYNFVYGNNSISSSTIDENNVVRTISFERADNEYFDPNNLANKNNNTVELINDTVPQVDNLKDKTEEDNNVYTPIEDKYYEYFETFTTTKNNLMVLRKALTRYAKNTENTEKNKVNFDGEEGEESEEQQEQYDNKNIGNIYLKTVLYISKNHWTVWINDTKITNINNNDEENEFYITKVNENQVDFIWRMFKSKFKIVNSNEKITGDMYRENEETNKIELKLSLSPNQTFVASENKIIDGKYSEYKFVLDKETTNQQPQTIVEEDINFDELMKNL